MGADIFYPMIKLKIIVREQLLDTVSQKEDGRGDAATEGLSKKADLKTGFIRSYSKNSFQGLSNAQQTLKPANEGVLC